MCDGTTCACLKTHIGKCESPKIISEKHFEIYYTERVASDSKSGSKDRDFWISCDGREVYNFSSNSPEELAHFLVQNLSGKVTLTKTKVSVTIRE